MIPLEDERSIANKLAREEQREHEGEEKDLQKKQIEKDPTLPVRILTECCRKIFSSLSSSLPGNTDSELHCRPSLMAMSQARVPR